MRRLLQAGDQSYTMFNEPDATATASLRNTDSSTSGNSTATSNTRTVKLLTSMTDAVAVEFPTFVVNARTGNLSANLKPLSLNTTGDGRTVVKLVFPAFDQTMFYDPVMRFTDTSGMTVLDTSSSDTATAGVACTDPSLCTRAPVARRSTSSASSLLAGNGCSLLLHAYLAVLCGLLLTKL